MFRSLMIIAVASTAAAANAGPITGLYNTGVTDAGTATTGNGADPHWTLAGGTAYNGAVNGVFPIPPWLAETSTARWITPDAVAAATVDAVDHDYVFSLTFNVANPSGGTKFVGQYAADNAVESITLNGTTIASSPGGFTSLTSFASNGGFVAGANTLTFTVRNFGNGSGSNPAGLLVEFGSSTVPEAATWGLMLAGFGLVGFAARRRAFAAA